MEAKHEVAATPARQAALGWQSGLRAIVESATLQVRAVLWNETV